MVMSILLLSCPIFQIVSAYHIHVTGINSSAKVHAENDFSSATNITQDEPILYDMLGNPLKEVYSSEEVLIQFNVHNRDTVERLFLLITQIKDRNGYADRLSWTGKTIKPSESSTLKLLWIPEKAQDYTIEFFVWDNLDNPKALDSVRTLHVSVNTTLVLREPDQNINTVSIGVKGLVGNISPSDGRYGLNMPVFLKFRSEEDVHLTITSAQDSLFAKLVPSALHAKPGHRAVTNLFLENIAVPINDIIIIKALDDHGSVLGSKVVRVNLLGGWSVDDPYLRYSPRLLEVERGSSGSVKGSFGSAPGFAPVPEIKKIQLLDLTSNTLIVLPEWLSVTPTMNVTQSETVPKFKDLNFSLRFDVAKDASLGKYIVAVTPETENRPGSTFHLILDVQGKGVFRVEEQKDFLIVSPLGIDISGNSIDRARTEFPVYVFSGRDREVNLSVLTAGDLFGKAFPDHLVMKAGQVKRLNVYVLSLISSEYSEYPGYQLRLKAVALDGASTYRDVGVNRSTGIQTVVGPFADGSVHPHHIQIFPGSSATLQGEIKTAVMGKIRADGGINYVTVNVTIAIKYYNLLENRISQLPGWLTLDIVPQHDVFTGYAGYHMSKFKIKINLRDNAPLGEHLLALQTIANASYSDNPTEPIAVQISGLKGIVLSVEH
ncbi:MAG: hypothetical protein HMLIMOIP_001222 [Candidatus Nitrosomirales archaeon]|jgi:hypothetical protein